MLAHPDVVRQFRATDANQDDGADDKQDAGQRGQGHVHAILLSAGIVHNLAAHRQRNGYGYGTVNRRQAFAGAQTTTSHKESLVTGSLLTTARAVTEQMIPLMCSRVDHASLDVAVRRSRTAAYNTLYVCGIALAAAGSRIV